MYHFRLRGFLAATVVSFGVAGSASAGAFSGIFVFGDSLSDAGNLYAATGLPTSPPYAQRFSNGPVWVEQLAPLVGAPVPTPSLFGGTDFAFGGARATNTGLPAKAVPSVEMQVGQFLLSGHAPKADELYILWGGANDLFDGQTDPTIPETAIKNQVQVLAGAGAKHIWVMDLPPIQNTPEFLPLPQPIRDGIAAFIGGFNFLLKNDLASLQPTLPSDLRLEEFDTTSFLNGLIAHGAQYGLTNVTESAFVADPFSIAPNANEYLFWDGVHPTTVAHGLLAANVPEPTSITLVVLAGIALARRRRTVP